jgi:hypothetical protein
MRSLPIALLLFVAACETAEGGQVTVDSGPAASCSCPTPHAVDVSFYSEGSSLTSTNVQTAIRELEREVASRPRVRIETVEATEIDMVGNVAGVDAYCPIGAIAVGVTCLSPRGTSLLGTNVSDRRGGCDFNKSDGVPTQVTAKVTCLFLD